VSSRSEDPESTTDRLLEELVATPARTTAVAIAIGTILDGQYRIERLLGQGGMGTVYLARDLRLERDVAVKVGTVVSASALQRIEREAVAIAKLSHPNVVVAHQVGEVDGRLYIAMEYVDGGNARQWRTAKPRSWREVALLYAGAGDGLAAAHAAGFIHRDFKPDNVLVSKDERPRVADFGLVRASTASSDAADAAASASPLEVGITRVGAVLGTPPYMPPEQLAGRELDARTDQFAFCASVWEALFERRPFDGETEAEIAEAIATTIPTPPEHAPSVPRRLVAALRRGLAADREARWPSLQPLLDELRRDPSRRRRRIALGTAGLLAIGAAVIVPILLAAPPRDPCADGKHLIALTWNPERTATIEAAFAAAHLETSWTALEPAFAHYAQRWKSAHRAACRASRVEGSQSEAILDRRMLCLSRARAQLDATLDALRTNRDADANAASALKLLPDLAHCADLAALGTETALPTDPALRAKVEEAAKLVDGAATTAIRGWDLDPQARTDRALVAAREVGWPPLIAKAMLLHAGVLASADAYRQAAAAALAAGDDATAAQAFANAGQLDLARSLWTRLGSPAALGGRIEQADATRLLGLGDATGALAATRRAIELARRADPSEDADADFNLATALAAADQLDDAQREVDRAIDLGARSAGPRHPMLSRYLRLAAVIARRRGDAVAALASARRAVAIDVAWYQPDDARLAASLDALADQLAQPGDPTAIEAARAELTAARPAIPKQP
jgi:hypothetical protein